MITSYNFKTQYRLIRTRKNCEYEHGGVLIAKHIETSTKSPISQDIGVWSCTLNSVEGEGLI